MPRKKKAESSELKSEQEKIKLKPEAFEKAISEKKIKILREKEAEKKEELEEPEENSEEEEEESKAFQPREFGGFSRAFVPLRAPVLEAEEKEQPVENLEQFASQIPASSKANQAEGAETYSSAKSSYANSYSASKYESEDNRSVYDREAGIRATTRLSEAQSLRPAPIFEETRTSGITSSLREMSTGRQTETVEKMQAEEFAKLQEQYRVRVEEEKTLPFRRSSRRR